MASAEWVDPWPCGACTYQHVEPAEARLDSCSISGTRRPVGSAAPPDSNRQAAHGPRSGLDHDGDAVLAAAETKQRRTDARAPPAMGMALDEVAAAGQLQPPTQQERSVSAAALQQLVALVTAYEPDLNDLLLGLCKPWHTAAHKRDLPPHPAGPLGTFAVTVPEGSTEVGRWAFHGCSSLTKITLPPTLTGVRAQAFEDCTSLAEITLPPALTVARPQAFDGLTEITLPPTLIEIGHAAFHGCTSLTKITLPPALTVMGLQAFDGCTSLTEITLPPTLTDVRSQAFDGCRSLAFYGCTSLTGIALPPTLAVVRPQAFDGCKSLAEIALPDTVRGFSTVEKPRTVSLGCGVYSMVVLISGNWPQTPKLALLCVQSS